MTNCDHCEWAQRESTNNTVMGCQMDNPQEFCFMRGYQAMEQPCPDFKWENE